MAELAPERNTFVFYRTFEIIEDVPIMAGAFWYKILIVGLYVAFVTKIGPELMKNCKPYQLTGVLKCYNLFQVLLSIFMAYSIGKNMLPIGIIPKREPFSNPQEEYYKKLLCTIEVVCISKFTELLDTIFFVLRKKNNQITFLHVFHHAYGAFMTFSVKYSITYSFVWSSFINACVHTVMYSYYFIAALGPRYQKYLTWKKYMTGFQILQFATLVVHQTLSLYYTKGEHLILGIALFYFNNALFLTLFIRFYIRSYKKETPEKEREKIASGKMQ